MRRIGDRRGPIRIWIVCGCDGEPRYLLRDNVRHCGAFAAGGRVSYEEDVGDAVERY